MVESSKGFWRELEVSFSIEVVDGRDEFGLWPDFIILGFGL